MALLDAVVPSLLLAKPSCSPTCPHLSSNEGNFPFEKSKTGLGEALVAGLSASLQRPLAPLRHLWLGGGSGLVLSGVALMAAQRTRAIAGGVCVRQMERSDGGGPEPQTTPPAPAHRLARCHRPRHRTRCDTRARARSVAPAPREPSSIASTAAPPRRRAAPPLRASSPTCVRSKLSRLAEPTCRPEGAVLP